ncbi:Uncharacterised protein [Klebsiella pneumoniae]|uniref:hypothetical protein n=1 Tax=Klebsiella pneumoniae TaxID=573 RepID=UPI000E08243B|nr:hypothetical protein [Klebsiella pneumoniae]MCD5719505.1 hypothetical protein [Klebsiella pneumoniae]MCP5599676.1 hypothetical protein [Klebsiella pneumoniae]STV89622.1 Uncharacterised protein [Klebsiella pneumoniae]
MTDYTPPKFNDFEHKDIYLTELWFYAYGIKNKMSELNKLTTLPEKGYILYNLPEITDLTLGILSNAANIKKMMLPVARGKSESAWAYTFRVDRCNMIKSFLSDIDISEIMNSKVRNSLEHFDEYLDEFAIKMMKGIISTKKQNISFNMATSELGAHEPPAYPIRQYCAKEKVYYNMDTSVDIGKISHEAMMIHNKFVSLTDPSNPYDYDYPTGMIIT